MEDDQGETAQIAELVIGDGTSSTIWQQQLPTKPEGPRRGRNRNHLASPRALLAVVACTGLETLASFRPAHPILVISTPSQRSSSLRIT